MSTYHTRKTTNLFSIVANSLQRCDSSLQSSTYPKQGGTGSMNVRKTFGISEARQTGASFFLVDLKRMLSDCCSYW